LNNNSTTLLDEAVPSIDSRVAVSGGNLLVDAPFSTDDLFQIIACHGVIFDSDAPLMLRAAWPPSSERSTSAVYAQSAIELHLKNYGAAQ
jgi:hypothetical protein